MAAAAASTSLPTATMGYQDLSNVIDKQQSYALNVDDKTPYTNLFTTDPVSVVRSDSDEQM